MFGRVVFVAETEADIDRFVSEYVLDAGDRIDAEPATISLGRSA